jgi:hypothetical protein
MIIVIEAQIWNVLLLTHLIILVTSIPVFYLPLSFDVLSFENNLLKYLIDNNNLEVTYYI